MNLAHATPAQIALHQAHKARIARMSGQPKPTPLPKQAIVVEQPLPEADAEQPPRLHWFEIISDKIVGREPRISEIQDAVCRHFQISKALLLSTRRGSTLVLPRHIGMYLARELSSKSYPEIGRRFRRDHTVPIFAARKIAGLIVRDPAIAHDVAHIAAILGERG